MDPKARRTLEERMRLMRTILTIEHPVEATEPRTGDPAPDAPKPGRGLTIGAAILLSLATGLEAQRGSAGPALRPPGVSAFATPVSVAWQGWDEKRIVVEVLLPPGAQAWNVVVLFGPNAIGDFARPTQVSFDLTD